MYGNGVYFAAVGLFATNDPVVSRNDIMCAALPFWVILYFIWEIISRHH